MKKTISMTMMVLAAVCAAFGEMSYEKGRVYGPIVELGDEARTIDGNGAIIDGGETARCATLGPNVTLVNFTFRNGKAAAGGGVWGGAVSNCTISGCTATEYGAAVANCKVSQTAITGCTLPLSSSGVAIHGGIAADSTLDGVTITGCRVELGTSAPGFGGIAANSMIANCTVTDNTLVISGDHYGLLFYDGSLERSTIQGNSVGSSVTNVVAYMKVMPVECALDGNKPLPPGPVPPGPTPEDPFDGTVANNYVVMWQDGSTLVISTAKQTVEGDVATSVLTAKLTVGKKTYSYTGGKITDGEVTVMPICKTSGTPRFDELMLTRNEVIGVFDAVGIHGNRLREEDFDVPELVSWTSESPLRVGVAYSATLGVSAKCGPVKFSASKLPSGLKLAQDKVCGAWKVTGVPTKAGEFMTRVTATSTINSKLKGYTEFENNVTALDSWTVGTFYGRGEGCEAKVTISSVGKISGTITLSGAKWTVSSTTFNGYANGVYSASLVCKKGKVTRSFEVSISEDWMFVTDTDQGVSFTGNRLTKEDFDVEDISWTSESPLRVGVAYSATLGVSAKCGPVKYSASKLPSGLKLAQDKASGTWKVTGVPTAAKLFATRVTATSTIVSSLKAYTDFPSEVAPLDTWAQGTFDGGGENCQVKITVSKTGKISGQILEGGRKWMLSGKSFDDYETDVYYAAVTAKNGKTVLPCEISLSADGIRGACEAGGSFTAQRNCWKEEPWKMIAKSFPKAAALPVSPHGEGFGSDDVIELKFAASGAVTAKGKFVKSYSPSGKPSYYSASCSTAFCPSGEPDESGAFAGTVQIYYPPKKNTPIPNGNIERVTVRWTGAAFELAE